MTSDDLTKSIIANGFADNDFLLDLNGTLSPPDDYELPAPYDLPSRLFQFPIETTLLDDGTRLIGLMHPLLADHPWCKHVAATLGVELNPGGAPNDSGYSSQPTAQWWHAVDLIESGHWRELIETQQFTTPKDIMNAVAFGLDFSSHTGRRREGYISTADARVIMEEMGSEEPRDHAAVLRAALMEPSSLRTDKGPERWPVNTNGGTVAEDCAWSRILGLELGWLKHDAAGFVQWTPTGRDRFSAGAAPVYVDKKTGQAAFNF